MKKKTLDIKKFFEINNKNIKKMVYLQKISLPTIKNLKSLNNFSFRKNIDIINSLEFIHPDATYDKNFWKSVILFWITNFNDFFLVFYQYLDKIIKSDYSYIIYDIDFKIFTNKDSALVFDPERYVLWFIGEYIKFKKIDHKIISYKTKNGKQKKFNILKKERYGKNVSLKYIYSIFSNFVAKFFKPKYIIDDIGITFRRQSLLNLSLGQFPFLWEKISYKENEFNSDLRSKFLSNLKFSNQKEEFYNQILSKIFPKIYIEDFEKIAEIYQKIFPKAKIYITSNYFQPNHKRILLNILKQKKVDIFLAQHGGGFYGLGLNTKEVIASPEQVEKNLSKNYLTWGWKESRKDIIFTSRFPSKKIHVSKTNRILFCSNLSTTFLSRQFHQPRTMMDSLATIDYVNDTAKFLKSRKYKLTLRYLSRIENSGNMIYKNLYVKSLNFDEGKTNLFNELKKYKLVIHENLLSTAFLETLAYGFPTLILMGKNDDLYLRRKFKLEVHKLKKANIVHSNFKSLQNFLKKNLDNIESWWEDSDNKKIVKDFTNKYACYDKDSEKIIKKLIKKY